MISIFIMRRIKKQSCRNSLSPIRLKFHDIPQANGLINNKMTPQGLHRKYYSTVHSVEEESQSPLCIRKQILRKKVKVRNKIMGKQPKQKRKQPTEHFNYKFIETMKLRRECINWVHYNVTLGIAIICDKMKKQMNAYKWRYNEKIGKQMEVANNEINNIMKHVNLQSSNCKGTMFKKDNKGYNQFNFEGINSNQRYRNYKQPEGSGKNDANNCSTALATPNSLSPLKDSICKLNSYFCLLSRNITMKKQDNLINQFIQRRRSMQGKFTPHDLQEFNRIMKINQQRCELMNQILTNVNSLKSYQSNILIGEQLLRKIGQIDLMKDLANIQEKQQQSVVNSRLKSYKNFIFQLLQPPIQSENPFKSNHAASSNNINQSLNSRPKRKKKINYRSSIQSYVPRKQNNNNVASKLSQFWREKTLNKQTQENERPKKMQNQIPQSQFTSFKKRKNQSKLVQTQEKTNKKKTITFFDDSNEKLKKSMKMKNKMKSAVSIKSNKEITWNDLQAKQWQSLRSLKSFKSLKSIGSQSNISARHFKSLKTQREMKYLNGRFRKIIYGRKYRTKLFKLNDSQKDRLETMEDFLVLSNDNKMANNSKVSLESLTKLNFNRQQSQQINESCEKIDGVNEVIESKLAIKNSDNYLKKSKDSQNHMNLEEYYSAQSKQVILKNFMKQIKMIQKQNNIAKQKGLILNELQKMYEAKIITKEVYERYKALFKKQKKTNNKRVVKLERIDSEDQHNNQPNLYNNLSQLREAIGRTTELNQINKYYYNISQFKCEEEQINQTKQATNKQDFFFIIRNSIQHRRKTKKLSGQFICQGGKQSLLYQKGL